VGDKSRGLFRKFEGITRTDGSSEPGGKHYDCDYFVLDMTHDAHAPAALRAYADSCAAEYPLLAEDLRRKLPPPPLSPAPGGGEADNRCDWCRSGVGGDSYCTCPPCAWCVAERPVYLGCCDRAKPHHHTIVRGRDEDHVIPNDDCTNNPTAFAPWPLCGPHRRTVGACERCDTLAAPFSPPEAGAGGMLAIMRRQRVILVEIGASKEAIEIADRLIAEMSR